MMQSHSEMLFDALQTEHEDLNTEIQDVEQFWTEVNELGEGPKYEEMASRVHRLHERLKHHFADEERGYLTSVVEIAPQLVSDLEELKKQHQDFLDTLDRFSKQLENREAAYHNWEEVHQEFDEFLGRLHEHEAAEMEIVRKASV